MPACTYLLHQEIFWAQAQSAAFQSPVNSDSKRADPKLQVRKIKCFMFLCFMFDAAHVSIQVHTELYQRRIREKLFINYGQSQLSPDVSSVFL